MKTLAAVLSLTSFLQKTVIPLDLVLIILILRSFVTPGQANLFLAFGFGLLISLLTLTPLGIHSLSYLLLTQSTHLLFKFPFSKNILIVIPWIFITLSLNSVFLGFFTNQSLQIWPKIAIESLLALPIYLSIKKLNHNYG